VGRIEGKTVLGRKQGMGRGGGGTRRWSRLAATEGEKEDLGQVRGL